jgi:flavin-dependent dehydrogenase
VGGGPAGAVVAATLARGGYSVLLLERSRYEGPRVGEHLTPDTQPLLESLGLWERFRAGSHRPSSGVSAAWGSERLNQLDYVFSIYGAGWNLDRARFDRMLADAAVAAGAELILDARLVALKSNGEGWHARLVGGARGDDRLSARFLVDATGRAASVARRLGSERRVIDQLVALCAWLPPGPSIERETERLLVEAMDAGWWYATGLPGGRRVAVFLSDRDLLPHGPAAARLAWTQALARTRHVQTLLDGCGSPDTFRLRPANSYILDPLAGPRWLAVGDAASALDPLSSMGILKSLLSGMRAASAVSRCLAGDEGEVAAYAEQEGREFRRYLDERREFYERERRWRDHPFWRSRQSG